MQHFDIVGSLSQGGMADLFMARARTSVGVDRAVVIKRLRLKYAHDPEFAAMFMDEARIAILLEHANIVRTYEVGTWDGALYIALEHLSGADLAHLSGADLAHLMAAVPALEQTLTLEAALTIARCVAAALEHAHTRTDPDGRPLGIIHRDISPSNVFICEDGQVKLLDFGVASYADRLATRTPKGVIKGKFPYLSPEQCLSNHLDARTDLFSLGVMLYELTCGRRPFRGLRAVDIVQNVIEAPCDPPSRTRRGFPPELERLLLRVLSKRPEDRHATAGELGRDLENVARRLGLVLSPGTVAHFAASATALKGRPGSGAWSPEETVALYPTQIQSLLRHPALAAEDD